MKKVLVTGSNGQLGNEIKVLSNGLNDFTFLFHDIDTLDLTDTEALKNFFRHNKPDYVINCAAFTAVDKAETETEKAYLLNAGVPAEIASLCKDFGSKLIHISTDYVFDGKSSKPYTESDVTNPLSVYGKSKLEGEMNINAILDSVIIRTSWLYSIYGNNFLKTMLRIGAQRESINVVFDQIGTPTCANDLAGAILTILSGSENVGFKPGIYHYSNEGVCSWYDFAYTIMELTGIKSKIIPITTNEYPLPAHRPEFSVLNKNKIKSTFSLSIPYWKESVRKTLEKLIKN